MNTAEFLVDLRAKGIALWSENEPLHYRGPSAAVTAEIRSQQALSYAEEGLWLLNQIKLGSAPRVYQHGGSADIFQKLRIFWFSQPYIEKLVNMIQTVRANGSDRPVTPAIKPFPAALHCEAVLIRSHVLALKE